MATKAALMLIDLQIDFLPGGALAVPEGDRVIPIANEIIHEFPVVVATKDWHPADHGSFAANHEDKDPGEVIDLHGLEQVLWPVHCVQETTGADFAPGLLTDAIDKVFFKGTDPTIDSYSGFFDNGHRKSTGLGEWLRAQRVTDVYIMGLATDYCVQFSARDALQLDFATHIIPEGCRGVNLQPGDADQALQQLGQLGVQLVPAATVLGQAH
jgi:nicotinamidase/pyrazinamidase